MIPKLALLSTYPGYGSESHQANSFHLLLWALAETPGLFQITATMRIEGLRLELKHEFKLQGNIKAVKWDFKIKMDLWGIYNIKHRISSDYFCLESSRSCLHQKRVPSAAPVLTKRHQEAEILTSPFADCPYPRSPLLLHNCVLRRWWKTTRKQNNIWSIFTACKKQTPPFYQGNDADFYIIRCFVGKWGAFLIKALFLFRFFL